MEQSPQKSHKNIFIAIAVIVTLAVAAVALYVFTQKPASETTTTQSSAEASKPAANEASNDTVTDAPAQTASISFTSSGFAPASLTVKKGTVVTVKNDSSTDVQFSSDEHPTHKDNNEMNLQILSPGQSASFTPSRVGTWGFHDHIDDSKTGTLVVTE